MNQLLHDVSWVIPYRTDTLTTIFELFTWLGYPTFIMILLALGYWLWNKNAITRISLLVILSTLLNTYLKDLWQNPRPDIALQLDPGVGQSYGMPSGHAQIAFVLWFGLAYEIKQRWAWIVAAIIVAGVCFSRIYLGVHDLEDILAGALIATASLFLYARLSTQHTAILADLALWKALAALLILTVVLHYTWPNEAFTLPALSLSGFLYGWLIGRELDQRYNNSCVRNLTWAALAAIVVGTLGFIGLFAGLKPIMSSVDPAYGNYIRTATIGLYITFIAPFLFKTFKIAAGGAK